MKAKSKIYAAGLVEHLSENALIPMRKRLNADAMIAAVRADFKRIDDKRAKNVKISLPDALMSGVAMFAFKDPSLLAFDQRRCNEPESLHGIFGIVDIPCDSQMRAILDEIDPRELRRPFRSLFSMAQRGKLLENMTWLDGHYLLSIDGTGVYSSEEVSSTYCLQKRHRNGRVEYYQQMVAAAFVHPDRREVLPLCPEMIVKQDGSKKQDCERRATARLLDDFKREHPHLKVIVVEDAIASNAPHIQKLQELDLRFILGAKPGDHGFLYEQLDQALKEGHAQEITQDDPRKKGNFQTLRFVNGLALNKSNPDLLVNVLEYFELDIKGKVQRFCWVTDLVITSENAYDIMLAGRARWRIENETFNTLKNQGYNLGHNYGLGKRHLSAVFIFLMMLAFLVDQIQQMCCPLFQAAWQKCTSKRRLWEKMRGVIQNFIVPSMEVVLRLIIDGTKIVFT